MTRRLAVAALDLLLAAALCAGYLAYIDLWRSTA